MGELGVILVLCGAVAGIIFWVWRLAQADSRAEAYKEANAQSGAKVTALQGEVLADVQAKAREDRRLADEIVVKRDAAGARELLRRSTDSDLN